MPFAEVRSREIFPSPAPLSMATVGPGDIEKQTSQVIEHINTLVNEQGGTLADICKITIFLTSRDHLPTVMEVRRRYFKQPYPATSAVIVAGLANAEWMIEIEALAALK